MSILTDSDLEGRFQSLGIRQRTCSIADLPAEILICILLNLEWRDVLRLRQMSKALRDATHDKAVWLHLYETSFPGIPKQLDYPYGLYTVAELETTVVRGLKANVSWRSGDGRVEWVQRDIPGEEEMDRFWLSDSGRWLVVLTSVGSVVYHDLDNAGVPGRTLISRPSAAGQGSARRHMTTRMAVDVCPRPSNSKLEFNLALYLSQSPEESHFEVWKVLLQLENEGELPVLVAEKLASLERESEALVCHISLLGDDLAYSQTPWTNESAVVTVFNWKTASTHSEGYKYHKQEMYPAESGALYIPVHLLPGSRIFVMTSYSIQLFHYGDAHGQPCLELWHHRHDYVKEFTLSKPYICPETNSIRMIVSEMQRVLGCIIPYSLSKPSTTSTDTDTDANAWPSSSALRMPPGFVLLYDHGQTFERKRWRAAFGYRTGIVHCESEITGNFQRGDSKLYTLSYSWPDDEDPQVNRSVGRIRPGRWQGWQEGYNELTGRVVMFSSNSGSCISVLELHWMQS